MTATHSQAADGPKWQRGRPEVREAGAAAVEYALLIAFIATVVIAAVTALGLTVEGLFVLPCAAWNSCP